MSIDDSPGHVVHRPRRLRRGHLLRRAVADIRLTPDDLVMPLFVRPGQGLERPISSMPGVSQLSPDTAERVIRDAHSAGIYQFILFGITEGEKKDAVGSAALDADNAVNLTLRRVRDAGLETLLYADLCFCEYTNHGHCGALHADPTVTVDNDVTLDLIARQAVVLARSGVDVVAPSGMMDGQVAAVRRGLDVAGFAQTAILSYSVKYASSFYGPFREAGEGSPQFGDRCGYQMDWRRSREWRTELHLDLAEGADMVMVKPAAGYLDIIRGVRDATSVPVAAYHVSGEYAMLHAAADRGWLDLNAAALETTCAIKRAGADLILTYFARQLIEWL